MNELIKLAKQVYGNKFADAKYSSDNANEVLRNKFIELNGGSTKLDFKALRKHGAEMFEIMEEILENTVLEGLPDDNFFRQFVEFRNVKLGDQNSFYVPDKTMLVVSEIADGTTVLRRQRLDVGTYTSLTTSWKGIKVYEHLSRLLSGRVDFDVMLREIEKAFRLKINNDIYDTYVGSFASLPTAFSISGSFDEDKLLDIIDHVESASGKTAIIAGTRKALRKVSTAVVSDSAKEDMYKIGHYGNFAGTEMLRIKQVHTIGGYTFKLSENDLYITTTEEKPVKFITEGEARVVDGNFLGNKDMTQDHFFATQWGTGTIITDLFGKYEISG